MVPAHGETGQETSAWNSSLRAGALLFFVAVASGLWVGPSGLLYWDSYGYVEQALTGHPGGLALGRPFFVMISHTIARGHAALGGSAREFEPVLRLFWLVISALTAPGIAALARGCGLDARGAWWAGLAVALSPAFAHTSRAVLTDAPAAAAIVGALCLGVRARPGSSGLVAGLAFGLREQSAAVLLSLALLVFAERKETGARVRGWALLLAGFAVSAAIPLVWAWWTTPWWTESVHGWLRAMSRERAQHPYGLSELGRYFVWLGSLGIALLAGGLAGTVRWSALRSVRTRAFAVCVPSLAQLALLGGYQDIGFSPRYLVGVFAPALALPFGWWICTQSERTQRSLGVLLLLPLLCAGPLLHTQQRALRAVLEDTPRRARALPERVLFVGGQSCPGMHLERRFRLLESGSRANALQWRFLCAGWDWPSSLRDALERERSQGTTLVLDLRSDGWTGRRQQASLAELRLYAREVREGVLRWE